MRTVQGKIDVGPLKARIFQDRQLRHGEGRDDISFGPKSCDHPVSIGNHVSGIDDSYAIWADECVVNYFNSAPGELSLGDAAGEANVETKAASG